MSARAVIMGLMMGGEDLNEQHGKLFRRLLDLKYQIEGEPHESK
jgi:hypothetical protein